VDNEILNHIPHRPPFLFIDEIVEITPESLTARFTAKPELEFFKGHYPGNPIMPGVLISEAVFQAGALFLAKAVEGKEGIPLGGAPVLTRIRDARFRSVVKPGDTLTIKVTETERMGRFIFMKGSVTVDTRRVMTVDFGVAISETETA